jgi:hypothetical protein
MNNKEAIAELEELLIYTAPALRTESALRHAIEALKVSEKLTEQNEHLIACMKSQNDLVLDVMHTGVKYIDNLKDHKTYSVSDSWYAIKKALPQPPKEDE